MIGRLICKVFCGCSTPSAVRALLHALRNGCLVCHSHTTEQSASLHHPGMFLTCIFASFMLGSMMFNAFSFLRRPLVLGWRPLLVGWRLEAIASRLEAIAGRLEALEAIAIN